MNILFTSVGRRSYLLQYFKDALGENGEVHAMNSSELSPAFLVADHAVVSPLIYDENYIPFLKDYCVKHQIDAIISLFDVDLLMLARHKQEFADIGVTVVVSDPEIIETCNDKWNTYQFLKSHDLPAPKTYLSVDEALADIAAGALQYPLVVKPRWGMGSLSVYFAEDEEELRLFFRKVRKEVFRSYLKYESASTLDECVLIQEKLNGQEYGLDIVNDLHGKYQTTFCKMKNAMRSGETDCAVTVDSEQLRELGRKMSGYTQHIGNMDCDVFLVNGVPHVLEMNARFGGGYPFSHVAGGNLPKAIVQWLSGREADRELFQLKYGMVIQKDIQLVVLKEA